MIRDLSEELQILEQLVRYPTVSHRSNTDLIEYVSALLNRQKVSFHLVPDASGDKLGLIAHIGPQVDGGVLLSGHTDVVPVEGQNWASDPWTLTCRGGNYYGRGTCDMKGFLALVLAAVPQISAAPLVRPIQFAFSFDEEIGCLGTQPILQALQDHLPRASSVIVGEPSMMGLVTGHKGGLGLTTTITGKAAHSSRPDLGVSAIEAAATLIQWHKDETTKHASRMSPNGFTPPYSTAQVGTIHGGIALNTIPQTCVLESDIRFVPPETGADWVARYQNIVQITQSAMKAQHGDAHIVVEVPENIPALNPEPQGTAAQLVRGLTGDNNDRLVSYQTEAGHFQATGYSTVICGPGSIEQAHGPDEFISAKQLQQGQTFLTRLIQTQC